MHPRYGHTANIYKHLMIIFGGESRYNSKLKIRECLNELWSFNLDSFEW